ncbi:MAG: hypothetical protein V5B39_06905 [Accumulibacter sp.]|jgi:hypothetical protein|uniref:hypothetical protein n=1 Tax=Accumulibacter sp. TaxID=2053492 RepID=UPI002FC3292E
MKVSIVRTLAGLALAMGVLAEPVAAQGTAPQVKAEAPHSPSEPAFGALPGRWVRPDGGYVITIKSVDARGKLDAAYANPNPLPFSRAEAVRNGNTIRLFFELRAGGYNGSTYTLSHDPTNDILKGVYYQAVMQQKFDVYFTRAKQ